MRLSTGCRTPSSNVASSTFGIDRASVSRSMSRQLNRTYRTRIVTSSTETRNAPALVYPARESARNSGCSSDDADRFEDASRAVFPAAAGLAKAAGGEFLLSAVPDSLPAGGRVDDCPGHPVEAVLFVCDNYSPYRRSRAGKSDRRCIRHADCRRKEGSAD